MNKSILKSAIVALTLLSLNLSQAQDEITITHTGMFGQKPIPVALEGFSGEAASVLKFDLYVQGFSFVSPDAAQYVISGSDSGNVVGTVTDRVARKAIFSRSYSGASMRRQAHFFANDIVQAVENMKGIGLTKMAFKSQAAYGNGEIYVADFDGNGAQSVTSDSTIVAKPAWEPGRLALFYTSYAKGNPDVFLHNLSTGQRRVFAGYPGLNTGAQMSPDGSKVVMILSKAGRPNVYVCNADGSNPKRLTTDIEDSSPCWSPDGQWICFATKKAERRRLAKIPADGGEIQYLNTSECPSPTEPDWSPDGKWIAFTRQVGGEFDICVLPADGGGAPVILVEGQNPSWSPNSRTLLFNHGPAGRQTLSVLDVFTKQYKDCHRTLTMGSDSEPAWAR